MSSEERVDGPQEATQSANGDPGTDDGRERLRAAAREQAQREKEEQREKARAAAAAPELGYHSEGAEGAEGEPAPWSPLVPIQPHGSKPPFFLVHAILGSVFPYHRLGIALGEDRPVYGLQSKGLDGVETPLETIPEMAKVYLEAVRSVQPEGPYHIGGYSMGGWIAFEMAQQLSAAGESVAVLAAIGTPAPFGGDAPGADAWRWTVSYVEDYYELWRNSALADSRELQDAFFAGGAGRSGGASGPNPFGFPEGFPGFGSGANPFGTPGANPFGMPGSNPFGMPGGNPFGMPGAEPGAGPGWGPGAGGAGPEGGWPKAGPAYRVAWTNAAAQMRYVAESYAGGVDLFLMTHRKLEPLPQGEALGPLRP